MITTSANPFASVESLKAEGFLGFESISSLWRDSSVIPTEAGVYAVLSLRPGDPEYLFPGVGGFFKGRDPNVSISELRTKWVSGAVVVYFGKAGGATSTATLRSRLRQYLKFGQGHGVGHSGGRYIWQLAHHRDLLLCWRPTTDTDPRQVEGDLITTFERQHGKLPFANLVR